MLDWFATQRFAPSDSPLRERRLCQFAGPGTPSSAPTGPDPEPEHDPLAKEKQELLDHRIEFDVDSARAKLLETVEAEPTYAEKVLEKAKEVHDFIKDTHELSGLEFSTPTGELTNVRNYIRAHGSDEDRALLENIMEYLEQKMDAAAKLRGTLETLTQWEQSQLTLTEFKNAMATSVKGFDDIDDPTARAEAERIAQEKLLIIQNFENAHGANWAAATQTQRAKWKKELDRALDMENYLMVMNDCLENWKQVNAQVKGELVKAFPKQQDVTDEDAATMNEALKTTFAQWEAGTLSLEDLRTAMEQIYTTAGIGGKEERLKEIDKAIAKWNAAANDAEKKKIREKLHLTIGMAHAKNHVQRKMGVWAKKKLEGIRAWEGGQMTNEDFEKLMHAIYECQDAAANADNIAAVTEFKIVNAPDWATKNVSTKLQLRDDLADKINLLVTKKFLNTWASLPAPPPPPPPTVSGALAGTPAATPPPPSNEPPEAPAAATPPAGTPANPDGGDGAEEQKPKPGSPEEPNSKESAKVDPLALQAHHGGFFKKMGIEFYSINDIWGGIKRVAEAYGHGWHERKVLKETAIAEKIGKAIPGWSYLSGEVKLSVEKASDDEKNKETREFKEYLEGRNITFKEIFEGHGDVSMAHLQAEPPKARAVLEYAASRGWLYDITAAKNSGKKTVLGYDIDKICSDWGSDKNADRKRDNYFIRLIGENASGQESEMSKGKKKEHYTEKAKLFIDAIDESLTTLNFWEGVGIAQRAIERGLAGEISPWIATTVMRHLTENKSARKFVNQEVIDQFGLICLGHSARTLAFLKFDRAKITRWTKDPAMEGKVEAAGGFGTSIKLIQDAIIAKTGEEPYKSEEGRKLLYHQTAQVMSGQVVRLPNGKYISVFESGLVDYAKQMQNQGISRPSDEDDDYFRNISDVILADKDVYKNILELTGSGRFANKDKGPNFLRMLLELRDELRVKIPDAVTSFEDVTKPKLKNWIQEWLRESRGATSAFAEMPTESDRVKGRKGKPVIFLLIKEGLIDYSQVESAFREIQWSKAAPLLVQNLMQQLANEKNDPNLTNQYQEQARRLVNASRAGQPLP
jgi:hypothetical protein